MSETPARSKRTIGVRDVTIATLIAACFALLAALVVIKTQADTNVVSPDDVLNGVGEEVLAGDPLDVGASIRGLTFKTVEGGTASTDQLIGQPIVINMWASTCVPCVTEMPMLDQAAQLLSPKVKVIGVSVRESAEAATGMQSKLAITYPLLRDPEGTFANRTGTRVLPRTIFIDSSGTIAKTKDGAINSIDELTSLLEGIS